MESTQPNENILMYRAVEFMRERRSIRRYSSEPVATETVKNLLEAATWAPSAHNRQPWRFAIIQSPQTKHRLAKAMGKRLKEDLESDRVDNALIKADVNRSYQRITGAPVLVLLSLSMQDMDSYTDSQRQQHEKTMAVQSTAMAGQNLMLAAHAFGLGSCWLCAPLFCPDTVIEILNLPYDWQPQGLISLGYPAEVRSKDRQPLETRAIFINS